MRCTWWEICWISTPCPRRSQAAERRTHATARLTREGHCLVPASCCRTHSLRDPLWTPKVMSCNQPLVLNLPWVQVRTRAWWSGCWSWFSFCLSLSCDAGLFPVSFRVQVIRGPLSFVHIVSSGGAVHGVHLVWFSGFWVIFCSCVRVSLGVEGCCWRCRAEPGSRQLLGDCPCGSPAGFRHYPLGPRRPGRGRGER